MQLHQFGPTHKSKRQTRVGRGGKRGTMSGRGQKGQKSRSGHKIRPAERDLIQRLPKLRGFNNKAREAATVVNVGQLEKMKETEVTIETLKASHLVPARFKGAVKVLGEGELKRALTVKGLRVSKSAKEKIEKAGGKVI